MSKLWPPGSERVPHWRVTPGTEVLMGGTIRRFDRCERPVDGSHWLIYWQGINVPTRYQEEPVLVVWPAKPQAA
ncbi:hypothetical protein GCM10009839_84960 [Catenulispora yoronensis]|uniref:Uncharacterized protein n=1 Tax=Catenulispora yoronensis TaxID=450799 RepID=A0ABN2VF81_9ACTN